MIPRTPGSAVLIIARDRLVTKARGKGSENLVIHVGLAELDMAVGEEEIHSSGVVAVELIHLASGISRTDVSTRVPQYHSGGAFRAEERRLRCL